MDRDIKEEKNILGMLNERAKELKCLYKIEEIINDLNISLDEKFRKIIGIMPSGWQAGYQYAVRLECEGKTYLSADFKESCWGQSSPITADDQVVGSLDIYCESRDLKTGSSPMLPEEQDLLNSIAGKIGQFISRQNLKNTILSLNRAVKTPEGNSENRWESTLELLQHIDRAMYEKIARKMLNHLCWIGIKEARSILQCIGMKKECSLLPPAVDLNTPLEKASKSAADHLGELVFPMASKFLNNNEVMGLIKKWVDDEKVHFLSRTLEMSESSWRISLTRCTAIIIWKIREKSLKLQG